MNKKNVVEKIQILLATAVIFLGGIFAGDLHLILKGAKHVCYNNFIIYVVPSFLFSCIVFLMIMFIVNRVNAQQKE